MAKFDDIGSGSLTNFSSLLESVGVNAFDNLVRGLVFNMLSTHVNNFNLMNHDFMELHMFRNSYERNITLNTIGENAYRDGNPDNMGTPAQYPSYTKGNNYIEFITNVHKAENNGVLTTRVQRAGEENTNKYLDMDSGENQVSFTGSFIDKNSILYKTKKLMRQQKIKTIISQFHTKGVEYNGQVGSEYGESHGRNLLTKDAENGNNNYSENGYDNPYCRVWTHHYKYDTLKKTMRADSDVLNMWDNFEWNYDEKRPDKGHEKDNSEYGDVNGENYDYSWRGYHNQTRREKYSVLDTKTGLVKITPQYRGGEQRNRHTKECMFSIENLAWKDYDPYSFEQALSWEQRGPFGGRIMWFPPYGIEITETATAKWQTNEFIGRGEPVYTYVNSERSGNLSFMMITDHPSSIDYASWWDDNTLITGIDGGDGNSENDYLRYFAGCSTDDSGSEEVKNGDETTKKSSKTGGLIIKPTPLTDEYTREAPVLVNKKELTGTTNDPNKVKVTPKNPNKIEFLVFYPNNYSGVHDAPSKPNAPVNAIAYLLGGVNAQKKEGVDAALSVDSMFSYVTSGDTCIGYEMGKTHGGRTGITTENCIADNEFIQGGIRKGGSPNDENSREYPYSIKEDKKWCYRIDHFQPYVGGYRDLTNLICEELKSNNYQDNKSFEFNLSTKNFTLKDSEDVNTLYSFAEVAAAFYSKEIMDRPYLYGYLIDCGVNQDKVNDLIKIFSTGKLTEIECSGYASSQGYKETNEVLARNRARTVIDWLHTYSKWRDINTDDNVKDIDIIKGDSSDADNVDGKSFKLGRYARCVLTFSTESTITEDKDLVGFKLVKSVPKEDGVIWNYYRKDNSVKYYDQVAKDDDTGEKPSPNDIVVNKSQIIKIFNTLQPIKKQIINDNPKYRGLYNESGGYIVSGQEIKYAIDDLVSIRDGRNRKYYKCLCNYSEAYGDFSFDVNDWDEVTVDNIEDAISSDFRYIGTITDDIRANDIVYVDNMFKLCIVSELTSPFNDNDLWERVYYTNFTNGYFVWTVGDYVVHEDNLYICKDETEYSAEFNLNNWDIVNTVPFESVGTYTQGTIVNCGALSYYIAKSDIDSYSFTSDLSSAIPRLITSDDNPYGFFDGNYMYGVGDYCLINGSYYKSKIDFSTKTVQTIPFNEALSHGSWEELDDKYVNEYTYPFEINGLVKKSSAVLCTTVNNMIKEITGESKVTIVNNSTYDCVWKYGTVNDLVTQEKVKEDTDLVSYAQSLEPNSRPDSGVENTPIKFTEDENNYLSLVINNNGWEVTIEELRTCIILCRILEGINKIKDGNTIKSVCETAVKDDEKMVEKTKNADNDVTEDCKDSLWVDRGDGMLIQECNLSKLEDGVIINPRFNAETGEGEWNKLRYDQEYHFFKQYFDSHPILLEKLQEKIKYFNPAFHSMTPEGFNARCTFLQQCTRQGNTKTMSDIGGKTANNLAFGRPPYCVLRLGDFYNQMIVIENVNFDYSVSDGLQWDLNTEGNGVQPMLCKVNISFKFIGGGDITGPVQRLQNAMSFNYYANTSFYDNRADRVEYQDTNWKTMGGAGNDELNLNKSYTYVAKTYNDLDEIK